MGREGAPEHVDGHLDGAKGDEGEGDHHQVEDVPTIFNEGPAKETKREDGSHKKIVERELRTET